MHHKRIWIRYAAMLFLILAVGLIYSCKSRIPEDLVTLESAGFWEEPDTPASSDEMPSDMFIYVHVCGAVMNPGVYELPAGSRVYQAVEAAGGYSAEAYEPGVNLAQVLTDGQQLIVLTKTETEASKTQQSVAESGLIDLNTADRETLKTLPGIGDVRADAILLYREEHGPFQSIEELKKVPGIKEASFEALKEMIIVNSR